MRFTKLALGFIFIASFTTIMAAPFQPIDKIVAEVNNGVITQSQLNKELAIAQKSLAASGTPSPSPALLRKQVLTHMINTRLQLQLAKRSNVTVSPTLLNNALESMAQKQHTTITGLSQMAANEGVTLKEFKKIIKTQLILQQVQQAFIANKIKVTPQDIAAFKKSAAYQSHSTAEYNVEDILISLPNSPSTQDIITAREQANGIYKKLKAGANFKQIAAGQSAGQEALSGGSLGWRTLPQLPEVFSNKVTQMKVGSISKPIQTANGFHIIKLAGERNNSKAHLITETKLRQILLIPNPRFTSKQIESRLLAYRKELINGANFANLAEKYSQDPTTASKGGSTGWTKPGSNLPPIQDAIGKLEKGQISQPIHTRYGWYLVEVTGRRQIDDSKAYQANQIRDFIFQRRMSQQLPIWIAQLRAQAYIKTFA